MPILIRETTIRADLSGIGDNTLKNEPARAVAASAPVADLEGHIQKLLLRKLKTRDER